jgi:hypothetical protein
LGYTNTQACDGVQVFWIRGMEIDCHTGSFRMNLPMKTCRSPSIHYSSSY